MSQIADASTKARLTEPVDARDHTRGLYTAPLTLLEYADFECPQCGLAFPIVASLQRRFGETLRFVYRHFPITSSHPHAQRAAESAEWAGWHGAFWPMHDALFAQQQDLSDRQILRLAAGLSLSAPSLQQAWAEHTYLARVKAQFLGGVASEVTGTPAFFINGIRHDGPWDADTLGRSIEGAL
jgi:protein-disulfide isomerase